MDALLAEGAWVRRLAAALASDPDEADDLAQETWLAALRSGPRSAAAARGWLRRVLLSRLRDARRAGLRRATREAAATEPAAPDDPEALAARMELHERVATHMAALDEPVRQVLFLRFVEGLEPVEVARRLGIPAGTARWRLKRGIDELRTRLDADFGGERRRWLGLFLPLLPQRSGSTRNASAARAQLAPWSSAMAAKLAASALVIGVAAFGASRACTAPVRREAALAEGATDPDAAARRVGQDVKVPAPHGARAVAQPRRCPEAEALEQEREALAAAAEPLWKPQVLFARSAPSPETEQRLRQVVDAAFPNPRECGHTFECRGLACRVEVVVPESTLKGPAGMSACVDLVPKIRFQERATMLMKGDDDSTYDPFSRTWLRRRKYYLRLADASGEPVPPERRVTSLALPEGWNREPGPLPRGLAPECEASVMRARRAIEGLVREMERGLPPRTVFASGAPNPALSRDTAEWLRPCLVRSGEELPVDVACRGNTCALSPRSPVRWKCPPEGTPRGPCVGDVEGDRWFGRLLRCRDLQGTMEVVDTPVKWPSGVEVPSALVWVRPPAERKGVPGKLALLALARERGFAAMVDECERLHPARGVLLIRARVPEACGPADTPATPQLEVELGGELFGSELAACLAERMRPVLEGAQLPRCVYGWQGEFGLAFPHPEIDLSEAEQDP